MSLVFFLHLKIHLKLFTLEATNFLKCLSHSTRAQILPMNVCFSFGFWCKTLFNIHTCFSCQHKNERIGNVAEPLTIVPTQTTFSADSYMLTEQMIMNFICRMVRNGILSRLNKPLLQSSGLNSYIVSYLV